MLTTINLDEDNRMLRFGFGKNEGRWFARIDLWWIGFRLTGKREEFPQKALLAKLEEYSVKEMPMAPVEGQMHYSFDDDKFYVFHQGKWTDHLTSSTPQGVPIPALAMDLKPYTWVGHQNGETLSSLDGMGQEFK